MAADSRSPRDGKHLEVLGYYNPLPGTPIPSFSCFFLGAGEFQLFFGFIFDAMEGIIDFGFMYFVGQDGGKRMGLNFDRVK